MGGSKSSANGSIIFEDIHSWRIQMHSLLEMIAAHIPTPRDVCKTVFPRQYRTSQM